MSKFKVGDRVRVFDIDPTSHCPRKTDGTVARVMIGTHYFEEVVEVQEDQGVMARILAHPKSCRRLIKKPRRRFWIQESWLENGGLTSYEDSACVVNRNERPGFIECIEVRKVKK